uniref:Protein kinase domain-containing protein n=2 Tax=Magallana TaxID=2171616 RepID=A0A8W8MNV6_MAGGI
RMPLSPPSSCSDLDPVTDTVLLMPESASTSESFCSNLDEKMDIDEEQPRQHQTLEFFEMCASLITTLAR